MNDNDILKTIQVEQQLPKRTDSQSVAKAVYELYKHTLEQFKPYYKACDTFQAYYKPGANKRDNRPSYKTNAGQNVIFSNIEAAKPVVEASLTKPGIYATNPNDVEACTMLEKRVASAWKASKLQFGKAPKLIHNVLVDGTAFIKVIYNKDLRGGNGDVKALLLDNRRVLFDPTTNIEESYFVMDVVLSSVGETRQMFPKTTPKGLEGTTRQEDYYEGKPAGPAITDGVNTNHTNTEFYIDSSGNRINTGAGTSFTHASFNNAEKVIRIECWFWDTTLAADGTPAYPNGRVVTVVVGADSNGNAKYDSDLNVESYTLKDIENPYSYLAEYTGSFPFYQIQCHDIGEIWGVSEVANQTDSQDLLNDAINTTHDNWKLNNNPIRIGLKKYGITNKTFTNRPGELILIDAPDIQSASGAFTTVAPPNITSTTLPFIQLYTKLNERDSAVGDAIRGVRPAGVTSGTAIKEMKTSADNRFQLVSRAINSKYEDAYTAMAYIAQEFDEEGPEGFYLDDEDINPLMDGLDAGFIQYKPEQTRKTRFKVESVRQATTDETVQILTVVAQLDAQIPGMGAIALENIRDKKIKNMYQKLMADVKEQKAAEQDAELQAQNSALTQQLLTQGKQ